MNNDNTSTDPLHEALVYAIEQDAEPIAEMLEWFLDYAGNLERNGSILGAKIGKKIREDIMEIVDNA